MTRKQVGLSFLAPGGCLGDQRLEERVDLVGGAVVSVQGDIDIVAVGDACRVFRQRYRAKHRIVEIARRMRTAAGRDLDQTIAARFDKTFNGGIDSIDIRDVDRGKGVVFAMCLVQHFAIALEIYDRHGKSSR